MSRTKRDLENLVELREAVLWYLAWLNDSREGIDDTGALEYWEREMWRLSR